MINIKWHGRDIECEFSKLHNKFGASVGLLVDGKYFAGSTFKSSNTFIGGYYRFDTEDDAIRVAIKDMEAQIEHIASNDYLEIIQKNVQNIIKQADDKRKVATWLMKLIK